MHVSNSHQKRNGEKRQNTTSCMLSAQLLEIHQHGGPEKDFSDTSGLLALLPSPAVQKADSPTAVPTAPGRPRPYPFPRAIATPGIAQAAPRGKRKRQRQGSLRRRPLPAAAAPQRGQALGRGGRRPPYLARYHRHTLSTSGPAGAGG